MCTKMNILNDVYKKRGYLQLRKTVRKKCCIRQFSKHTRSSSLSLSSSLKILALSVEIADRTVGKFWTASIIALKMNPAITHMSDKRRLRRLHQFVRAIQLSIVTRGADNTNSTTHTNSTRPTIHDSNRLASIVHSAFAHPAHHAVRREGTNTKISAKSIQGATHGNLICSSRYNFNDVYTPQS